MHTVFIKKLCEILKMKKNMKWWTGYRLLAFEDWLER